jgi:hypothetical protein
MPENPACEVVSVALLQPDDILRSRILNEDEFIDYMGDLKQALPKHFAPGSAAQEFVLVVVAKPNNRERHWFIQQAEPPADVSALDKEIAEAPVPGIQEGPVAVAFIASISGAPTRLDEQGPFRPPVPQEWRDAAGGLSQPILFPDVLIEAVWPD